MRDCFENFDNENAVPTDEELNEIETGSCEYIPEDEGEIEVSSKLFPSAYTKRPLLTAEQEIELAERVKHNDIQARNIMIESNIRLVMSIARRYLGHGLDLDDLVQNGIFGLMKAVDKFDSSQGFRFSTYASWWIKQSITRSISDFGRAIRIPVHISEKLNKIQSYIKNYSQRNGFEPTSEEIADVLGFESARKVEEILRYASQTTSLDTPVGDDDGSTIYDFVPDEKTNNPDQIYEVSERNRTIAAALEMLSDRERRVISLRFGFEDGDIHTLEEVGEIFGVTRERIRQIEATALRKLNFNSKLSGLIDFAA